MAFYEVLATLSSILNFFLNDQSDLLISQIKNKKKISNHRQHSLPCERIFRMSTGFPGFPVRQACRLPEQRQLVTGSGAVFISRSISPSGEGQPVTFTAEESVISSGAKPAKSENTRSLRRRKLSDLRNDAKADPLQGINPADPDGAFRHLCVGDDGEKLSHLLAEMDQGARQNWLESPLDYSEDSDTPVIYAARHGHASVVSALMNHGADPTAQNPHSEFKYHALSIAARNNQVTVIEKMAEWSGFDPNKPIGNGATAIYLALEKGAHGATEALLKLRADPNCAFRCSVHSYSLVPFTLAMPEAEPAQQHGSTLPTIVVSPVFHAVSRCDVKTLKLLLEYGVSTRNPDPGNLCQFSPLAKALLGLRRSPEVIDLLLKYGADMYEKIPVRLSLNEGNMYYRPSLIEWMSKHSLCLGGRNYFRVLYDHFCVIHDSQASYGNFRNYFLLMFLVNAFRSFPDIAEGENFSYVCHSLNKNIEIVESALSALSPGASQLSEENRLFLQAFCDCNRIMLKKIEKTPVPSSEFEEVLHAWTIKVETMGIHHYLSIPEIKELLEQEPDTSLSEWLVSQVEAVAGSIQSFSRVLCGN